MKKSIALSLVLIFGISLLIGCGSNKDNGSKNSAETIQLEYYSFALVKGWYLNDLVGSSGCDVKNETLTGEVKLGVHAIKKPEEILPSILNQFEGNKQVDNVTIGGIEYFMVVNEERNTIDLLETKKGANAIAVFMHRLNNVSLEQATPLIETLKMNSEALEMDEDEIKAKLRD